MKFPHVTDTHIVPEGRLHGSDPAERLRVCIADINAHHADAAAMIFTGDLTDAGNDASYARLRAILAGLIPPAHLLIGNHDRRGAFRAAFPQTPVDGEGFIQYALDTPAGRFLCLDTVDEATTTAASARPASPGSPPNWTAPRAYRSTSSCTTRRSPSATRCSTASACSRLANWRKW